MARSRKKLAPTAVIGQRGVALVESRVLEMGFGWHPTNQSLDVGIDGYIELADPATHEALGKILAVQVKATIKRWTREGDDSFEYVFDERDLEYWLSSNAPVVAIVARPAHNEAYWVHIQAAFADPDARRSRRHTFSKSRDKFTADATQALLSLAVPEDLGLYLPAPPKRETLHTNLLEVSYYPQAIYVARSLKKTGKAIWAALNEAHRGRPRSEWILHNKTLHSFHDLSDRYWSEVCDEGTVEELDADEWAQADDEDRSRQFVWLLNSCLREAVGADLRHSRDHDYLYFKATRDLSPRKIKTGGRSRGRTVFKAYYKKTAPDEIAYYRHSAFGFDFHHFGDDWFLEVTPTYHYTWDGKRPDKFYEDRLKTMKRLENNDAVAGQVRMWANYLATKTSSYKFLKFKRLAEVEVESGIDDRLWLGREPAQSPSPPKSQSQNLELFPS